MEHEEIDVHAAPYPEYGIEFKNVSFAYPNTDRTVLKNINVTIKPGEKVAIVGENGSGKTTFVNLLCGIYSPSSGSISIGGHDLMENLSRSRQTLSAIFQEFGRYETTIRENITISDQTRKASEQELQDLTEQIDAYSFISTQPKGFDEVVGNFSETGNNLSGGQWQKLAICRAAYRDKAKIMVLDEPTAALDPMAETVLYRNFTGLTGDRTTLLISHRLGIASLVDRVLVFDNGQIVEDGTHAQLLQKGGLYAKMYQAQSQWYED